MLGNAVSQRENILGIRPLVLDLVGVRDECLGLEAKARIFATAATHLFISQGLSVERTVVEEEVQKLREILHLLQGRNTRQNELLQEIRVRMIVTASLSSAAHTWTYVDFY